MYLATEKLTDGTYLLKISNVKKKNALPYEFYVELLECLGQIGSAKVIIVRGESSMFSSGIDLDQFQALRADPGLDEKIKRMQDALRHLSGVGAVTIAVVEGFCIGAGLELALACDFILSTPQARFSLPELRYGIIPDLGGISKLRERCGTHVTKKMVLLCEEISGKEALDAGLVSWVSEDVDTTLAEVTESLNPMNSNILSAAKRLIDSDSDFESERNTMLKILSGTLSG